MIKNIESGSSDKTSNEWINTYQLSKEQVRQLILNKFERAKKDHLNLTRLKNLVKIDS